MLEDWHTHNKRCHHAEGEMEDYIKKAIEKGLATIGLSDHFPYEFVRNIDRIPFEEYAMTLEEIERYLSIAESLREKYKDTINVRIGFEIDFFESQEQELNQNLAKIKDQLDYILGSIHILDFQDDRGAWGFDDSRFLKDYEFYGADKVYLKYYHTMEKMLQSPSFSFDIVSHLDLPKKFGHFPDNKKVVSKMVNKILKMIKEKEKVVEINTSGFRKDVKRQYPSMDIIKQLYKLEIPIVLGSDAHHPDEVAWKFIPIIEKLREIGFTKLVHFKNREKKYIPIGM